MMEAVIAIENGNLELFRTLVNANDVNTPLTDGRSWLRVALSFYRIDIINYLINLGADVNYRSALWWPIITAAVYDKQPIITKILLKAGAATNYPGVEHYQPLTWAIVMRQYDTTKLLLDYGAKINAYTGLIPKWVDEYITNRTALHLLTITLLTLHKQRQGPLWLIKQDKHVIKMIGKHIWSIRMLEQPTL
jgi:hypothetical protein